jgi:hypothetical protein
MYAILSIAFLSAIFAAIYGWVVNIATVFSGFDIMAGGEAVVRICGIFIPILGAVAGYF